MKLRLNQNTKKAINLKTQILFYKLIDMWAKYSLY